MASDYIHALRDRVTGWLASGLGGGGDGADVGDDVKSMPPRSREAARSGWTLEGEAALCDALRVENFEGAQVRMGWKAIERPRTARESEKERERKGARPTTTTRFFSTSSSFSLSLAFNRTS